MTTVSRRSFGLVGLAVVLVAGAALSSAGEEYIRIRQNLQSIVPQADPEAMERLRGGAQSLLYGNQSVTESMSHLFSPEDATEDFAAALEGAREAFSSGIDDLSKIPELDGAGTELPVSVRQMLQDIGLDGIETHGDLVSEIVRTAEAAEEAIVEILDPNSPPDAYGRLIALTCRIELLLGMVTGVRVAA